MNIVFAASEAAPFVKTGGLGDVAQALPEALSEIPGQSVTVFLPYYGSVKNNPAIPVEKVTDFYMYLSWRNLYVGVYRLKSRRRKLKVFFIDNETYFKRDGVYGYPDDGERFAFFSKAVLESMQKLGMKPDVIHCNDWQTALIPVLLHAFYQETLGEAKTVFTIHNIEYQGKTDPFFLGEILGLDMSYEPTLKFGDGLNFIKGALLCSDALTTVSKTYASELRYPYFAHGLDGIINEHFFKMRGIVNGIDTEINNPSSDGFIAEKYGPDSFASGKKKCKKALQKETGLPQRADVPVIGMVSRLVGHKGMDIFCAALEQLKNWDVQFVILGTGDGEYENSIKEIASRFPEKFSANICFRKDLASRIYAGSDIFLMPSKSEPCGLSQLIAMRYGSVPVVHETGGLKDTVPPFIPSTGEGLGFTFQSFSTEDMLDALSRALTVYWNDRKAWGKAVLNGMTADLSWDKPALEYLSLYRDISGRQ